MLETRPAMDSVTWIATSVTGILALVLILNLLAVVLWALTQLHSLNRQYKLDSAASTFKHMPVSTAAGEQSMPPYVSIHVPTHNEPPEVVCQTLRALSKLDYPNFEVILLDNNTSDERLWVPVQQYCRQLGSRFRFHHATGVVGAKSGALNIAKKLAAKDSRWICIVDADYQVAPDFLKRWLAAHERYAADYYQFPQAYRSTQGNAAPAVAELNDYFDRLAVAADQHEAMLLTGTLCVIDSELLEAVGGWPMQSSTEDAELGCLLQAHEAFGKLINECAGNGLLPPSFDELKRQRHRWICGNLQVLASLWNSRGLPAARRQAVAMQLTAWCSFTIVPLAVMLPLLLLTAIGMPSLAAAPDLLLLASTSVCIQFAATAILILGNAERSLTSCLGALAVRWALSTSSSVSTLLAVVKGDSRFRCTLRSSKSQCSVSATSGLLALAMLVCTWAAAQQLHWLITIAASLLSLTMIAEYWVDLRVLARATHIEHPTSATPRRSHVPLRQYRNTDT